MTLAELIKKEDYDYIEYRLTAPKSSGKTG